MSYTFKTFSMETPWLSKSSINLYNFCPYAFKLRYIDKIKVDVSDEMKRGTRFHNWAESIYDKIDKSMLKEGKATIAEEYSKYLPNPDDDDIYVKFIKLEEQRWGNIEDKERFFPILRETFLHDDELLYFGTFDRLDWFDKNTHIVVDYKSGTYRDYRISGYRFELFGYKHLIDTNHKDYNIKHFGLFFPDEGFIKVERFKKATKNSFYEKVTRTRERILNEEKWEKKGYCRACYMYDECTGTQQTLL